MSTERRGKLGTVFRVSSGNFLEMYDFFVSGYAAQAIGRTFFPGDNDTTKLMLSLATFGVGFLMRPVGALVLGSYIDRHGRRAGLLLTLSLMSIGTLSLALMPGYATLGLLAPILVLAGRLLQGFSAGVELGGVSVYLAEIATPGHKGFYVSWQSGSQQCAVIFAAVLGLALARALPPETMGAWGWRIPLMVGCAIVPFLFVLRRTLVETEVFKARTHHPGIGEILTSVAANWRIILRGVGLVLMTTVSFYVITVYTRTFGDSLHLSPEDSLIVTVCVGLSNLFWLPVMGAVSDKVGRRPLLIIFTILMLVTAWPALSWLAGAPSFTRLLIVELWLSFLYGSYNGAMVVHLTEIVPAAVRASGFALAYSLATSVGGFSPWACNELVLYTGSNASPGLWLAAAAALSLFAATRREKEEEEMWGAAPRPAGAGGPRPLS